MGMGNESVAELHARCPRPGVSRQPCQSLQGECACRPTRWPKWNRPAPSGAATEAQQWQAQHEGVDPVVQVAGSALPDRLLDVPGGGWRRRGWKSTRCVVLPPGG